uniref:Tripartite motif-containing protein 64-like n=1 Tax=Spermophilus dauricus TaxID=99837 RepID=A0A8C9UV73_SPEDA
MDSHALQDFQSALTCSICVNYFLEPITIDCGHTFCRPCIYFCWEEAQTPRCCPACRKIAEKTDYRTNTALKKLASHARQARPRSVSSSGEQICRRNGETKGLSCEVDKSLLSAPCSELPEYAVHSYSPVACMAEENREKIVKKMDPLWQKTQEMQDNLNKEIRKSESFDYVVLRRNMIKVQYQMMHQFLLEEERFQLETLEREAQEILEQLRDSAIRMAQHREKLKEMYRELMELCHKSDMEFVTDVILYRIELLEMQKLQPVNPELSSLHITGILDMLNKFRVNPELSSLHITGILDMIFGVDGANENPQTLESYVIWGVEAFNSGKHYWEVDVGNTSNWIIGVCKDFTSDSFELKKGFVLFSSKKNNHCILSTNSPSLIHYLQRPAGRVGVFLDYENGSLSFYDVCRGSLIYSFFSSSFTSPLTPFLVFGSP